MRKTRARPSNEWPRWMYDPSGEGQIFEKESDVPEGWVRTPGEVYVKTGPVLYDHADLVRQAEAKGIEINPIWGSAHLKRMLNDVSPAG
jgi:hypothetical protein